MNIYHFDIKSSNILIDDKNNKFLTRIIDWGMSMIINFDNYHENITNLNRVFQYNLPFSVIFFNKYFKESYREFLNIHGSIETTDRKTVEEFIINFINKINIKYGKGHLSTIYDIFFRLLEKNVNLKNKILFKKYGKINLIQKYIVDYIYKILLKYNSDIFSYFKNVFLKNVDVYGLITCYITIYDYIYILGNPKNNALLNKLKNIFMKYLFTNPCEVINVQTLSTELKMLNPYFEKLDISKIGDMSKKQKYSLELNSITEKIKID
jgi:serine/threonine protein kinase